MIQSAPTTPNLLLRLWRNQESRGVIIQILTMAALFAFMATIAHVACMDLALPGPVHGRSRPVAHPPGLGRDHVCVTGARTGDGPVGRPRARMGTVLSSGSCTPTSVHSSGMTVHSS